MFGLSRQEQRASIKADVPATATPVTEMSMTEMLAAELPNAEAPAAGAHPEKPGKQGRGRRLTDKERMEIIELTRQNPRIRHVELALRYNVNESTIRRWRLAQNVEKVEVRYSTGAADVRDMRQRGQVLKSAEFDAAIFAWIAAQRAQGIEPTPIDVRTKARELASTFGDMDEFKASSGWYYRFCRRYGHRCRDARASTAAATSAGPQATAVAIAVAATLRSSSDTGLSASRGSGEGPVHDRPSKGLHASGSETDTSMESTDAPPNDTAPAPPVSLKRKLDDTLHSARETDTNRRTTRSSTAQQRSAAPMTRAAAALTPAPVTPARASLPPVAQRTSSTPATPVAVAALPASAPETPSTLATASPSPAAPLSARQEAIAHFQQHYKHLLSVRDRLRFIKHLAHTNEDAEMYTVMDDETRIEFIKEFSESPSSSASAAPHASSGIAAQSQAV